MATYHPTKVKEIELRLFVIAVLEQDLDDTDEEVFDGSSIVFEVRRVISMLHPDDAESLKNWLEGKEPYTGPGPNDEFDPDCGTDLMSIISTEVVDKLAEDHPDYKFTFWSQRSEGDGWEF